MGFLNCNEHSRPLLRATRQAGSGAFDSVPAAWNDLTPVMAAVATIETALGQASMADDASGQHAALPMYTPPKCI